MKKAKAAGIACLFAPALLTLGMASAMANDEIKVGMMLPFSGTYAQLGEAVEKGFKLYVDQQGGALAGKKIQYIKVDDESEPSKATDNVNKLIRRDSADVIVGTVHSGVVMAMAKAVKSSGTPLIIPHAGTDAVTGPLCAPNIFRSSFSNWQPAFGAGKLAVQRGYKKIVTVSWKYTAGEESLRGFKDGIEGSDTKVVEDLTLPFPNVEYQTILTQISALKPDAVYAFFGGAGAAKFVKDYAAAGLNRTIPLIGSGFLTEGVLTAIGEDGKGVETTLHYGDALNTEQDNAFRAAYKKAYSIEPDVYAVQGYDAAQILDHGMRAVAGDIQGGREKFLKAMSSIEVNSPRGKFRLSEANSPVQDIYVRTVADGMNKVTGVAAHGVSSPSVGCRMTQG